MKVSDLIEALAPSEYRQFVKGWDKTRWANIFDGKYRIYLPLIEVDRSTIEPLPVVKRTLDRLGFQITDYVSGYAVKTDDPKSRVYRIGKILSDDRLDINPGVKQQFDTDPNRIDPKDALVVISRHPYDIAGMSTDRGWTSCMNLRKDQSNAHYIPLEIEHGTCVAYLIRASDKNIKRPIARIAIKPFINIMGGHDIALGVDEVVYGTAPKSFGLTVSQWADEVNRSRKLSGVFTVSPHVYKTVGIPAKVIGVDNDEVKRQLEIVSDDGMAIADISNPSEMVQLAAVTNNGYAIEYIDNPSERVQLAALKSSLAVAPSKDVAPTNPFMAWMRSGVFNAIKNPTPKVVAFAEKHGLI